jgi:hypothetical protein
MNLYPDASMSFRANHTSSSSSSSSLNLNTVSNVHKPRLPSNLNDERLRLSSLEPPSNFVLSGGLSSPMRQKFTLPSFLPSPTRFLQQLPASPASLLFSPLIKRADDDELSRTSSTTLLNVDDEKNLLEQIDHYFTRRRQYLQHNIDVSMNISRWILEHMIFYSVETLR